MKSKVFLLSILLCFASFSNILQAASKEEIDEKIKESIKTFYAFSSAGESLSHKAYGMLVFPSIIKAGFVLGGEYGEGALLSNGKTIDYYSTASASVGWQLGAQERSQIILFMTKDAYEHFKKSEGWDVGVDGSIAITTLGAGKDFTVENSKEPVIGFVFSQKGLMGNISLEGSKISKIYK
jgi:lipid-binding SYLF domain-containing protein